MDAFLAFLGLGLVGLVLIALIVVCAICMYKVRYQDNKKILEVAPINNDSKQNNPNE